MGDNYSPTTTPNFISDLTKSPLQVENGSIIISQKIIDVVIFPKPNIS